MTHIRSHLAQLLDHFSSFSLAAASGIGVAHVACGATRPRHSVETSGCTPSLPCAPCGVCPCWDADWSWTRIAYDRREGDEWRGVELVGAFRLASVSDKVHPRLEGPSPRHSVLWKLTPSASNIAASLLGAGAASDIGARRPSAGPHLPTSSTMRHRPELAKACVAGS